MKYRKKPVVIEAVRYMIDDSLPDWFMDRVSNNTIILHEDGTCHIKTLEGTMKSEYGDYIIRGVNGEVYPCKPDIFQKTYEPENTEEGQMSFSQKPAIFNSYENMHNGSNYIVTDPKGELSDKVKKIAEEHGYEIKTININQKDH